MQDITPKLAQCTTTGGKQKVDSQRNVSGRKEHSKMKQVIVNSTIAEDPARQYSGSRKLNFSHLVAPTDFSPNSKRAVDCAVQLARRLGARLTLLHVVPEPSALDYSMEGFSVQQIQGWEEEAKIKLAEELARTQVEYKDVDAVELSALHPRDEIVRAATSLSADLLVLSTHGYTGWKHILFGSDAEKILEHAPCPVLVVR
jgi:nucleotide-binding universal stress UspA family protein